MENKHKGVDGSDFLPSRLFYKHSTINLTTTDVSPHTDLQFATRYCFQMSFRLLLENATQMLVPSNSRQQSCFTTQDGLSSEPLQLTIHEVPYTGIIANSGRATWTAPEHPNGKIISGFSGNSVVFTVAAACAVFLLCEFLFLT